MYAHDAPDDAAGEQRIRAEHEPKPRERLWEWYVRLLPASTSTVTTKLLRFCSPRVRNQERPVVRDELLLELERTRGIEVLGVVGNNGLRDGLADGIHLRGVSTTLHTKTNVNRGESLLAGNKDRLVDLEAQDLGLQKVDGRAVNVNEATALLCVGDRSSGLQGNL